MQGDVAFPGRAAMLEEIDALPGSKREPAIDHWDREIDSIQGGADMGGHVVCALVAVEVAAFAFRRHALKKGFEVQANFWRGIFLDEQSRGRMPAEQSHQSSSHLLTVQPICDLRRDFREAAACGPDPDDIYKLMHEQARVRFIWRRVDGTPLVSRALNVCGPKGLLGDKACAFSFSSSLSFW